MTYERVRHAQHERALQGVPVSHLAELVRGNFISGDGEGPLIRPSGTFSPRGEGKSGMFSFCTNHLFNSAPQPFIMLMSSTAMEPRLRK